MLGPRLAEAKEGKRQVYFVDAAHFIQGVYLSTLWSTERLFVKSSPGRKRFNILAALNAMTSDMVEVSNVTTINAWSLVELFKALREQHPEDQISIILDNAPYQRCYVAQRAAYMHKIELVYLPPYSPNLNLIERAWKFIRSECLNSTYYDKFQTFCDSIKACVNNLKERVQDKAPGLFSWEFQKFKR